MWWNGAANVCMNLFVDVDQTRWHLDAMWDWEAQPHCLAWTMIWILWFAQQHRFGSDQHAGVHSLSETSRLLDWSKTTSILAIYEQKKIFEMILRFGWCWRWWNSFWPGQESQPSLIQKDMSWMHWTALLQVGRWGSSLLLPDAQTEQASPCRVYTIHFAKPPPSSDPLEAPPTLDK